jgi:hypothetical protein
MAETPTGPGGDRARGLEQTNTRSLIATSDNLCWLCRNGEPDNRWEMCDRCLAVLFQQIRRRREAALRLEPLEDGRRDPIGPVTDGRWAS